MMGACISKHAQVRETNYKDVPAVEKDVPRAHVPAHQVLEANHKHAPAVEKDVPRAHVPPHQGSAVLCQEPASHLESVSGEGGPVIRVWCDDQCAVWY